MNIMLNRETLGAVHTYTHSIIGDIMPLNIKRLSVN